MRKNEIFVGELTDKELFLLEDALEVLAIKDQNKEKEAKALIMKLYKFWEK